MKALGVDFGGSHVTAVVINAAGRVLARQSLPIKDRNLDKVVEIILECVNELKEPFQRIGVSVPGNVDPNKKTARYLPSFGWKLDIPLGTILEDAFSLPVEMLNDGRCAALAESRFGAGRSSKIFSMLTLGTGIGGALVIDGKLFEGCSFDAGDFGHHVIRSGIEAFACVCGKKGCFEIQASAQGLVRHFQKLGGKADNAAQVIATLREENTLARAAFENYMDDLSTGLANLITFYNPDTIAIGGGLSQASEVFENLQANIDDKTLPATRGKTKVVQAQLGIDAGAVGAALLGLQNYELSKKREVTSNEI